MKDGTERRRTGCLKKQLKVELKRRDEHRSESEQTVSKNQSKMRQNLLDKASFLTATEHQAASRLCVQSYTSVMNL